MRITDSARKHGVTDADMLHALAHYQRVVEGTDDVLVFIGPARDATMLEVGVREVDTDDERIVHAMKARPSLWP